MTSMVGATGFAGNKIPKGYKLGQIQNYTPQQMQLHQQQFQDLQNSPMQGVARGDQGAFDQLEAPALRQFGELQGRNVSRFSGAGLGGRHGSGFNITQNSAANDFAENLQAQRLGLQRQAQQDLWNMSNDLLNQRPYENFLTEKAPKKPSFLQSILGTAAPLAGAAIGGFAGGPMGAAMGANVGSQFGAGFSGRQAPQSDWSQLANLPRTWSSSPVGGTNNLRNMAWGIQG